MGLFEDLTPDFPAGSIQRVFGVVRVKLNGIDWQTKPGASLNAGGRRYTSQFGNEQRTGVSWEPVPSVLSVEFLIYGETDYDQIASFSGIAEYVTDVGLHMAAANCRVIEPPDFADAGGGLAITIEGDPAYKV